MSNVIRVEFLYEGESATDAARDVWNAASNRGSFAVFSPSGDEFPAGDQFEVSVDHDDGATYGDLRPISPANDGDNDAAPVVPHIELLLTAEELRWDDYPVAEEVEGMLELVKTLYRATDAIPEYVYGLAPGHDDMIRRGDRELPVTEADLEANRIRGPSWLMLFPPAMVETYGREFLLDAPVWRAEELDDGAVLLVAEENPMELATLDPLADYFGLWSAE